MFGKNIDGKPWICSLLCKAQNFLSAGNATWSPPLFGTLKWSVSQETWLKDKLGKRTSLKLTVTIATTGQLTSPQRFSWWCECKQEQKKKKHPWRCVVLEGAPQWVVPPNESLEPFGLLAPYGYASQLWMMCARYWFVKAPDAIPTHLYWTKNWAASNKGKPRCFQKYWKVPYGEDTWLWYTSASLSSFRFWVILVASFLRDILSTWSKAPYVRSRSSLSITSLSILCVTQAGSAYEEVKWMNQKARKWIRLLSETDTWEATSLPGVTYLIVSRKKNCSQTSIVYDNI